MPSPGADANDAALLGARHSARSRRHGRAVSRRHVARARAAGVRARSDPPAHAPGRARAGLVSTRQSGNAARAACRCRPAHSIRLSALAGSACRWFRIGQSPARRGALSCPDPELPERSCAPAPGQRQRARRRRQRGVQGPAQGLGPHAGPHFRAAVRDRIASQRAALRRWRAAVRPAPAVRLLGSEGLERRSRPGNRVQDAARLLLLAAIATAAPSSVFAVEASRLILQ